VKRIVPVVILLAIIIAQVILAATGFASADSQTSLTDIARRPDDLGNGLTLETIQPYAQSVAADWHGDAVLVMATMQIDWPDGFDPIAEGNLPPGGWLLLGYTSGNELLTMRIDRGSGTIVQTAIVGLSNTERDSYRSHVIDFSQASTTSENAAMAFEIAYGTAFRAECEGRRPQSWLVAGASPTSGAMAWLISYVNRSDDSPPDYMTGEIDWATGSIGQVSGQDAACAPIQS